MIITDAEKNKENIENASSDELSKESPSCFGCYDEDKRKCLDDCSVCGACEIETLDRTKAKPALYVVPPSEKAPKHASLTVVMSGDPVILSKQFELDEKGAVRKVPGGQMQYGVGSRVELSALELRDLLDGLTPSQALIAGITVAEHDECVVVTKGATAKLSDKTAGVPVVSRTKACFKWPSGPGWWLNDHDKKKDSDDPPLSRKDFLQAMYSVCPELGVTPHVICASASSHIYDVRVEKKEIRGAGGHHLYTLVKDAADIPRAGQVLFNRLWLAGYGYVFVDVAGKKHLRTIVDAAVWSPERLDFAGGSACAPGLKQLRPKAEAFGVHADCLDTKRALPDLTEAEERELKRLQNAAREAAEEESKTKEAEWRKDRKAVIRRKNPDLTSDEIEDILDKALNGGNLFGDFVLKLETGDLITVKEIYSDLEKYHEVGCCDPFDWDYQPGNPKIAILYTLGSAPTVFSYAHGPHKFRLHKELDVIQIISGLMSETSNDVLKIMKSDAQVYARGGELVHMAAGTVLPAEQTWLEKYLGSIIRFEKKNTGGQTVRKDCPEKLAKYVLASKLEWGLPELKGIATAPFIQPNGRIVEKQGFDTESGMFLDCPNLSDKWIPVSDFPTEDECRKAVNALWWPFRLFPFDSPLSRSVHLAAILTALVRKNLPTAPGFIYDAPSPGSGKTFLATCLAHLAGTHNPSILSMPESETERKKSLFTMARTGPNTLIFDNIEEDFYSSSLAAFITSEHYEDRILGVSQSVKVPTNMLI